VNSDLREVDLGMIFSLKNHSGSRLQKDNIGNYHYYTLYF